MSKENPKDKQLTLRAYVILNRAASSVSSIMSRAISRHDLTLTQFAALEAIYHLGSMNQNDLGKKIMKSGGNITLVVDNLEKNKLVKRMRDANNRRSVRVELTAKGKKMVETVFPHHVNNIMELMSALTVHEQETLAQLCKKLGTSLKPASSTD